MITAALLYFQPLRNGYLHILWMLLSGCIYAKKGTHRIFWEIKANNVCPLGSSFTSTLKIEMGRAVGHDLVQNLAYGPGLFFVSQNNLMQQKKMAKLAFYQNNLSLIPLTRVGPNKNFISCGSTQPEKKIGLTHLYSKMLFLGSFHFIIKLHSAQKIKYYKKNVCKVA